METDGDSDSIIELSDEFISFQNNQQFSDVRVTEVIDLVQMGRKDDGAKFRAIAGPGDDAVIRGDAGDGYRQVRGELHYQRPEPVFIGGEGGDLGKFGYEFKVHLFASVKDNRCLSSVSTCPEWHQ
jgi:hypothetical protein